MKKDIGFWASTVLVILLLTGSIAAVGVALAVRGAAMLLLLVAMAGVLAAIWIVAGRPRAWGGERDTDEHHWWSGGAASPHH